MQQFDDDELTIDFADVWYSLKKHIAPIRNITVGVSLAALAIAFLIPPTYESVSLIRIKPTKGISSSLLDSLPMGSVSANQQLISTYQEILKSRSVVIPVIEKFEVESIDKTGKYPDFADYVKKNINTSTFKDTELVTVAVRADSPEIAQAKNQMLLDNFLMRLTNMERDQYKTTRNFLEERVVGAKKDMRDAEMALNNFQKEHKILAPDTEVKMAAEKMANADKLKAENKVRLASGTAKAGASANALQGNAASVADNSVIKSYNSQLTKLEAQRVEYAAKYTEKHPLMIRINKDIAELQEKLNDAINNVANGNSASDNPVYNGLLAEKFRGDVEASIAKSNLQALADVEKGYKDDIAKLSDNQREYLSLMRDLQVAQDIYTMLAKRVEEAKVAEVSITRDVSIVDAPILPDKPVAPRKALIVVLAFLASLLGSSGFFVMRDLMNVTVKNSDDVDKYLGLPILGQIPSVESLDEAKASENMTAWQKIWRTLWKK